MILYIYLMFYRVVVYCSSDAGCMQTSLASFNTILLSGVLELVFELPLLVRIYKRKETKENA